MLTNQKNMSLFREVFHINILLILSALVIWGCEDKPTEEPDNSAGKLHISFQHMVEGEQLHFDTLIYVNEAGNPYLVNEIQYFISDVKLFGKKGVKLIDDWKDIHYVDTDIADTWEWEVYDEINPDDYDSISFVFGFEPEKNLSFMFVNPPEKDMFWPEFLGGGYHYMKLNGKWLPAGQSHETIPFDFHLGRGQEYYSYPDSITGYIENQFNVSLPASDFSIHSGETISLVITMHIEKWFMEPFVYDHDVYGGYIMQNQEAMNRVKNNGHNVFSIAINKQ